MADNEKGQQVVIPAGFNSVIAERANNWYKPEMSGPVEGVLKGRFQMTGARGKLRFYYQVMLTKPCKAMTTKDEENIEVELEEGDLINVDERKDLEGLAQYAADTSKTYEVFVQAIEKVKLASGNTLWKFAAGVR